VTPRHKRPATWRIDVVQAINYYQQIIRRTTSPRFADDVLIDRGYPPKQADRVLEDAADEGLIEYGVSARTGWLTDKGRRLLLDNPPVLR
jgi:hypothetical protein